MRIVTVSSSRYEKRAAGSKFTDESGDAAETEIKRAGNLVTARELVSDDAAMIEGEVRGFFRGDEDVLVLTGGTGVSSQDITIETVKPFFQKELPGFGELLRRISYREIGSAAMLTRATAGTAGGKLLVCLPGAPDAVKTALRSCVSEFPHIVSVARRTPPSQ